MPLVYAGRRAARAAPLSEAHERARKIDPRYAEGELVRVAGGRNQAEAELIQGMLLEEGVPSMLRRTARLRRARLPRRRAARRARARGRSGGRPGAAALARVWLRPPEAARPNPVKLVVAIALGGAGAALIAWLLQS